MALEDRIRLIRAKNEEIRKRQLEVEADRLKYTWKQTQTKMVASKNQRKRPKTKQTTKNTFFVLLMCKKKFLIYVCFFLFASLNRLLQHLHKSRHEYKYDFSALFLQLTVYLKEKSLCILLLFTLI